MRSRLRVLMVPDGYPTPATPAGGLFMRDLAHAVGRRHDVTVLTPPSASGAADTSDDGIRTIRRSRPTTGEGRVATLQRLRAINAVAAQLGREGRPIDLIHAHTFSGGFLAVLVGRHRRVPVVITENYSGLLTNNVVGRRAKIARFTYRSAAIVCPVSALVEKEVRGLEPRGRYLIVPDVVDIDAFANPPRNPRHDPGKHIVAVSMLVHRKGLDHLVEAVRLLVSAGREVTVTIIGEGPERARLEAQARGLPVEILGALPRPEVVARVRAADVFAMPTLADPFGISAVEALAAAVPVVVTSGSGTAELIAAHGGRVVPPGDPSALADALAVLLGQPDAVPTGTADELRRVCGPEAVSAALDAIYREVVAGPARGREARVGVA